jgi:predicted ATPase
MAKALVTSCAVLRPSGEHDFPVPPLPLPDPPDDRHPDRDGLAAVAASDAVRLFVERARAARPGFALNAGNAGAVAEVCRRLDGLPLALELAAARCRHVGPEELRRRLRSAGGGLPLLTGGPQDQPARQRTLRDTIAWSYDLLLPEQQVLFRRLAVFAGGWTAAAAAALVPGGQGGPPRLRDDVPFPLPSAGPGPEAARAADELRALDGLAALVDHSLVQVEDAEPAGGPAEARYRMLDTVREFAREQLGAAGEAAATARRHAAACLDLAEASFGPLHGADQLAWLARLDQEQPNVRAALAWCLDAGQRGDAAALEVGLRLAGTLGCWYWRLRAVFVEGGDWLTRLLAVEVSGTARPTRGRAVALAGAGHLATETDTGRSPALLAAAMEAARARADRWLEAFAQALLVHRTRDLPEARRHAAAALAAFQALGDTWGTAWAFRFLADPLRAAGDLGGASVALAQAAEGARAAGDRYLEAWSLLPMANLAAQRGDADAARSLLERSLAIRHEVGDRHGVRVALLSAANNAVLAGDVAAAAAHARAAARVSRELDGRGTPAYLLLCMASYVGGTSAAARAVRLVGAAATALETAGRNADPDLLEQLTQLRRVIRARVGQKEAERVWAHMAAMSPDEAVDYALAETLDEHQPLGVGDALIDQRPTR